MDKNTLIQRISRISDCNALDTERLFEAMVEVLTSAFTSGETVEMGSNFGQFVIKMRTGIPQLNSPRTPKDSHYVLVFKTGHELKRKMKIT